MRLVRYCCGCVGLPHYEEYPEDPGRSGITTGMAFVLNACDGEEPLGFRDRQVDIERRGRDGNTLQRSSLLPLDASRTVLEGIDAMVCDGYRFQQLKQLLKDDT